MNYDDEFGETDGFLILYVFDVLLPPVTVPFPYTVCLLRFASKMWFICVGVLGSYDPTVSL